MQSRSGACVDREGMQQTAFSSPGDDDQRLVFERDLPYSRLGSAIISPILKKPNLDPFELKSWRSISNLSFVSKLFERIAVSRLGTHISSNQLLHVCQSAYRKGHSTETAIAVVMNDIMRTVDRGEFCALVLLHLSAAFDTIDHGPLFDVLEKRFGMSHDALK